MLAGDGAASLPAQHGVAHLDVAFGVAQSITETSHESSVGLRVSPRRADRPFDHFVDASPAQHVAARRHRLFHRSRR